MIYSNTPQLSRWLTQSELHDLASQSEFDLDDSLFNYHFATVQYAPADERKDKAAFRCLTSSPSTKESITPPSVPERTVIHHDSEAVVQAIAALNRSSWVRHAIISVLIVILILLLAIQGHAQGQNNNPALVVPVCGTAPSNYPSTGRAPETVDVNGNLCAGVSVSATVATAGLAISVTAGTTSGTAVTPMAGFVTTSAPTYVNGQTAALSLDTAGALRISGTISASFTTSGLATNAAQTDGTQRGSFRLLDGVGGSNTAPVTNPGATIATTASTGVTVNAILYGYDGTNYSRLNTAANNSDGFTGNLLLQVQPAIWNGSNYDRLKSATGANATTGTGLLGVGLLGWDGSTNYVRLRTGTDGVLITTNGTTATTVTGTVTVTQTTTSNLHAMTSLESVKGSPVAVAAGTAGVQQVSIVDSNGNPITNSQVVNIQSTLGLPGATAVTGAASDGTTATGSPVQDGGVDANGKVQSFFVDPAGILFVTASSTSIALSQHVTCDSGCSAGSGAIFTSLNFGSGTVAVTGATSAGSAATFSPVRVAGKDTNGIVRDLLVSPIGAPIVDLSSTAAVTATLSAETTKVIGTVRVLGNAGAIFDAPTTGAVPANALYVGANAGGLRGVTAVNYAATGMALDVNIAASNATVTTTGSGTVGSAAAGVSTVQFADSANPFQDMVCPTNAFRIEGTTSVTGTSSSNITWLRNNGTTTTFTSPPGTGLRFYIFSAQLVNSGATNATVNLSADGAAGVPPTTLATWVAPTNTTPFGGSNMSFPSGMFTPTTGRALSIIASAGSTTVYANLQGCLGP